MNHFIDSDIVNYITRHTQAESQHLQELKEDTQKNAHGAQMLSDTSVTRLIQMLIRLMQASLVVDFGTYTGYSALAMAEAIHETGTVHTFDRPEQICLDFANKHFKSSPHAHKIHLHLNGLSPFLDTLNKPIDLAFIDADKKHTQTYFDLLFPHIKEGGIIIVDDCLWRGEILKSEGAVQPQIRSDPRADALHTFNQYIVNRTDLINLILPIRHGLNLIQKKYYINSQR